MTSSKATSWLTALNRSIQSSRMVAFSRFIQLATVSKEGLPRCRTVVFRGWYTDVRPDADPHALVILTDSRSEKVQDIEAQSEVEVCWYFSLTHEQFRVRGNITILGAADQDVRQYYWGKQTDETRKLYHAATPSAPCDPNTGAQGGGDLDHYSPQNLDPQNPSDNFAVLVLHPTRVDHLTLPRPVDPVKPVHRSSPHESLLGKIKQSTRYIHTRVKEGERDEWTVERVNP